MVDRRNIPPPPGGYRQPPTPDRPIAPAPQPPASPLPLAVLEVPLSAPYRAVDGTLQHVVRFSRPPGLGELVGFLDEASPESMARSLDTLPFRPEWLCHVLTACAGVPRVDALKIPARDLLRLGGALVPFVTGGPAGPGPQSETSPSDTDGAPETSLD